MDMAALPFLFRRKVVRNALKLQGGWRITPDTIGAHLLKARLARGLYQKEVADLLGVTLFTIINWEKGRTEPPARCVPGVIAFLGYDPYPTPSTIGERIRAQRRSRGLTIAAFAKELGVDPLTLGDWERGKTILYAKHRKLVAKLLGMRVGELMQEMGERWWKAHQEKLEAARDGFRGR